jgi:FKBP-type peptidyl-prolyl cis-trans isomerase FkpA
MSRLVIALVIVVALLTAGCGTEQKEPAPQTQAGPSGQTAAAQQTPEAQRFAEGLTMNPSGVRWVDMTVGTGNAIAQGSSVVFDYNCWTADATGLARARGIGTSVGRPGQAFKCQVGVHPLPGLSDGLIGMKAGGSRRIFVPASLGFPSGHPMAGNNLIYEVIDLKELAPEEVTRFQDSVSNRLQLIQRIQDRKADSLAGDTSQELGVEPAEGGKE